MEKEFLKSLRLSRELLRRMIPAFTAGSRAKDRLECSGDSTDSELRFVIGQLDEFAKRVSESLKEPTTATRRGDNPVALVKQIEIDEGEVRIVYRISPAPRNGAPETGILHYCSGRVGAFA